MQVAIIGLPQSGKSAVFQALTRGAAHGGRAPGAPGAPGGLHVGVTRVPDARLEALADIFHPEKVTPAEVTYWDIPAAPTLEKGQGIAGQYLNVLQRADALLLVVRAFSDPSVPHLAGSVDPHRDAAAMQEELAFADLLLLERLVERREATLKGAKPHEREAVGRELALLRRLKEGLEAGVPVREQETTEEERKLLAGYQLLTGKPLLVVFNVGEEQLEALASLRGELERRYRRPGMAALALCGKLEAELGQLAPEEEQEFRQSLGLEESGAQRAIRATYELLGLISFFTGGPRDVHAWTVPRGTPAVKAAGRVHSDMERGFIRAEVVAFEDLMRCGSLAEARRQGVLRTEGKGYVVQDGDVVTFLFSV